MVNEVLEPITTLESKRKVLKYNLKFQPVKTAIKKASLSPGLVAAVRKLAYVKETILGDVLASSGVDEVATLEENFSITSSVDIIEKETKITVTTTALVQQELDNALSSLEEPMFGLSRLENTAVQSALRLAAQDALKSLPIHELSELEIENVKSAVRKAIKYGLMSPDLVAGVIVLAALRKEMKDVVLEVQEIAELLPEASRDPTVINQPGTPPGMLPVWGQGMLPVWEQGRCTLGMGQRGIQPGQQGRFHQVMPLGMPLNPKERDQKWDQKGRTKGHQKGRIKGYPKKGHNIGC